MFDQYNTIGYTDEQLAALNAELSERLAGLAPESDEYQQAEKAFADEVASRTMIVSIELTDAGTEKFNQFFADNARAGIDMQAVLFELLDVLQDRVGADESLVYELRGRDTRTGNPALLTLDAQDITVARDLDA